MYGIERDENAAIFGIKYPALQFAVNESSLETAEIRRLLEQEKMKMVLEQWPEDVTSPAANQCGVVSALGHAREELETMENLKYFMAIAMHHQHCRLNALERLAQVEADRDELLAAAEAVIKRWDSSDWKDASQTAEYIKQLRTAVNNVKGCL